MGYTGLSRYEKLLEDRDGKPDPDVTAASSPDPRVIEGTATEVKPPFDRW